MDLDLVEVYALPTNRHQHLQPISSCVGTIGAGQVESIWPMLLEEGCF